MSRTIKPRPTTVPAMILAVALATLIFGAAPAALAQSTPFDDGLLAGVIVNNSAGTITVQVYDPDDTSVPQTPLYSFEDIGSTPAGPLAFDADGNLVITYGGSGDSETIVIDSTGTVLRTLTHDATDFDQAVALAFGDDGNIFVADSTTTSGGNHIILEYASDDTRTVHTVAETSSANTLVSMDLYLDGTDLTAVYAEGLQGEISSWAFTGSSSELLDASGAQPSAVRVLPSCGGNPDVLVGRTAAADDVLLFTYDTGTSAYVEASDIETPSAIGLQFALNEDATAIWVTDFRAADGYDLSDGTSLGTIAFDDPPVTWGAYGGPVYLAFSGEPRATLDSAGSGPFDLTATTIESNATHVSTFGGSATVTLSVFDGCGNAVSLGDISDVVITTSPSATVTSLIEVTTGTYTASVSSTSAGAVSVSATLEGGAIDDSVVVTFVEADPFVSTVTAAPSMVLEGGTVTVTVTPTDDLGDTVDPGTVVISTDFPTATATGAVVANGDGTYSQSFALPDAGSGAFMATYDGLALNNEAQVSVYDPQDLGNFIGLDGLGGIVADDFGTLQEAIDSAAALGVTEIVVLGGTYQEVPLLRELGDLTIRAVSGAAGDEVTLSGIRLKGSTGIVLEDIDFTGTVYIGSQGNSPSSDVLLASSQVTGADGMGVKVHKGSSDITIDGCSITGSSEDGIRVAKDTSVTVTDSEISLNAQDGIRAQNGSTLTLSASALVGNGRNAVRLDLVAAATLSENSLEDSGEHGLRAARNVGDPTVVTLTGNTFLGNQGSVQAGRSDSDIRNYDVIIDGTDDQSPYTD